MKWLNEQAVPWPNGAKCAACIGFDCDGDTCLLLSYPDTAYKHVFGMSWLQHDRLAIPRIVQLFDYYGIKQTFFVPAWCIERYPSAFEPVIDSGHEIAHHGYIHESASAQTPEGELYWLRRASETIERFSGKRPIGYRSPWGHFSDRTADVLAREGFLYDSSLMHDSFPYLLSTQQGSLIEIPSDFFTMDDWAQFAHVYDLAFLMQPRAPAEAARVYLAEFEAAYASGGVWITAFHPMVSGRLSRLDEIGRMIEYIQERGDVWFAPIYEIASHVQKCIADGSYTPRTVDMPLYDRGGVPELQEGFVAPEVAIRVEPLAWMQ
jgi:peptidoglycan/xylan/chitin deacetylase (PgdA/CDA1 family)